MAVHLHYCADDAYRCGEHGMENLPALHLHAGVEHSVGLFFRP